MTWLLRRTVDLFQTLARWYYGRKYSTLADRVGWAAEEPAPGRGLILIQTDGLSHEHLEFALRQGACPTLARFLQRGEACLRRWRCGVPSTTLATQAGLFYGTCDDIPAFRWLDKETGTHHSCAFPQSLRAVRERIAAGRRGLLEGGSSYGNLLDGGARLALFTLGALDRRRLFENVRGLGFLVLFLLSPLRVARVLLGCLWEYLRDAAGGTWEWIRHLGQGQRRTPSPLLQVLADLIAREVLTFCVMIDVYRGVPIVYVNYFGYDEVAHRVGPTHPQALRVLRGIDRQIHRIDRIRQVCRRREYDLFVLSDHGISPAVPFQERYGQTLGEFIAEQVEGTLALHEARGGEGWRSLEARFLLEELEAVREHTTSPALAWLLQRGQAYAHERWEVPLQEEPWVLERHDDIVVRGSGNLMHVYFNVRRAPLHLSEIALLYPRLLKNLVDHPGIGLVVGREGDDVVLLGKEGSVRLGRGVRIARGRYPLQGLDDPQEVERDLVRLARYRQSGDLIVVGAWDGQGQVVTFEMQKASHGGVGGPQCHPFLLGPRHLAPDEEALADPRRLHAYFLALREGREPVSEEPAAPQEARETRAAGRRT
ncbi:MAG: alkaline phosphatase family protein [Anaerolineae bacterium]